MKLKFFENDYGGEIYLEPETVEETMQLARLSLNAKKVPIEMNMSLSSQPSLNIWIKKVEKPSQRTFLKPEMRKP
jgi:hypothetical protein